MGRKSTTIQPGKPFPLGAELVGDGVNFAVFSAHAEKIELCLFSPQGRDETRLTLPERDGDIWHGFVPGLTAGALYGYRVHGPWEPMRGHRFNPNKLLIDPYARGLSGRLTAPPCHPDMEFDPRDSAPHCPKSVVIDPTFDWQGDRLPHTPASRTIIYEAHVKGLTAEHPEIPPTARNTFAGVASAPVIEHLQRLGVTSLELLPVQAFLDDRFLVDKGLTNYWGYQPIGFFAPEPRYQRGGCREFQEMVRALHAAGIEVILDVVFNHTGEGPHTGPTFCFRGFDNRSYYRLDDDNPRFYKNFTGTGNTLNLEHPMVLRLVLDSLRYWTQVMHVDGFRFDLAVTLGRNADGFDPQAAFFQALLQDPVLSRRKLIAEPWDIGPDGYRLGAFPAPFAEWNDRFRDDVRRFWRGDRGLAPKLAGRLAGSAEHFDHSGRRPQASINFVTAHDGFTLEDLVSYARPRNAANGEDNRDGHCPNFSDNMGCDGPVCDADIRARRAQRKRNLLATLFVAQGTPMLLAGDEFGNSQSGNNNAYCQDNPTGWINWHARDTDLERFVGRLIAFRNTLSILRQSRFLHGGIRDFDGQADLTWYRQDGVEMREADWVDPERLCLCLLLRHARGSPKEATASAVFVILNAGPAVTVVLPQVARGISWHPWLVTAAPAGEFNTTPDRWDIPAECVCLLANAPVGASL